MFVAIDGRRFFFDVDGVKLSPQGDRMVERPTVVALHGGPGADHSTLRPGLDFLTQFAQVVWLDLRGHGRSDRADPATLELAVWGDDVRAFCDTVGISSPIVFGTSFGGYVALAYAARHPLHAGALILNSTKAHMDLARVAAAFGREGGDVAARSAAAFWDDPNQATFPDYLRHCVPLFMGDDKERSKRVISRLGDMLPWLRGEGRSFDLRPLLGAVTCPTLVLNGRRDPIATIEEAREMAAALGSRPLRFHEFDAGHRLIATIEDYEDIVGLFITNDVPTTT